MYIYLMKKSAGILLYKNKGGALKVLLVHPGGPYWKNKEDGVWSIPKGEFSDNEEPLVAAKREFEEELGVKVDGEFRELLPVKQNPSKIVMAWAVEGDLNQNNIKSNTFPMEWPPKSGKIQEIPEVDKAEWFSVEEAKLKLMPGQVGLIDQLIKLLE